MTRVHPGLIRVDADELTYPAHVILRYGIERRLIEGSVEAEDIPTLWDEGMQSLLGIHTRGNYADGCMQDVHWSAGLFGYFPCYTWVRYWQRSGSRRCDSACPILTRALPKAGLTASSTGCAPTSGSRRAGCRPVSW
jgi:Zn-dependent M32 family carboxypeptidase